MKIKTLEQFCQQNGGDGPSFSTHLLAKSAILKMVECERKNRISKEKNITPRPSITLTGDEINAIFEVCSELGELAFQFSA